MLYEVITMTLYHVTRRIGIDAGHRIRTHGSKCRNLHGHRYEVEATCSAPRPHAGGEQDGMVIDFGFLKDEMLAVIDAACDHGFIAEIADDEVLTMLCPADADFAAWKAGLAAAVAEAGFALTAETRLGELARERGEGRLDRRRGRRAEARPHAADRLHVGGGVEDRRGAMLRLGERPGGHFARVARLVGGAAIGLDDELV